MKGCLALAFDIPFPLYLLDIINIRDKLSVRTENTYETTTAHEQLAMQKTY